MISPQIFLKDLGTRLRVRRWLRISNPGGTPSVYSAPYSVTGLTATGFRRICDAIENRYELLENRSLTDVGVRKTCGSFSYTEVSGSKVVLTISFDLTAQVCSVTFYKN